MNRSTDTPALLGGAAVFPDGPPDWPILDDAVREAFDAAWRDGSWGKYDGGHVARLETRLAALHGLPHALSCGSGTFAIELALRALRIGGGDEVILAAYDYPGNFLSVHAVGARPVLADVDPGDANLSLESFRQSIGPSTKAAVVSHLHGGLVPMQRLMEIAAEHGVAVVEDAAQAVGALVDGRPAGAWGDVGVLSFGGSKLLTAGRGGALLTRHADVHQRARLAVLRAGNHVCPFSEMQAAVLAPQLDRLEERTLLRATRVNQLIALLRDLPGVIPFHRRPPGRSAYYKLGLHYDAATFGLPRSRFTAALRAEGVALDEGFRALHVGRSPARFRPSGSLTEADRAHAEVVVLHHPVLLAAEETINRVAAALHKIHAFAPELSREA